MVVASELMTNMLEYVLDDENEFYSIHTVWLLQCTLFFLSTALQ